MRVPFLPIVLILSFMWAMSIPAHARTGNQPIIDCDKSRDDPITCTACNIYHEARGQADAGLLAVGLVTRNRVVSPIYKGDFCEVVWQKKFWRKGPKKNCWKEKRCGWSAQFSWTTDGKPDYVYNVEAWLQSVSHAKYVVDAYNEGRYIPDITFGALWYHRDEQQEPVKVVRDQEHPLRWHIWTTTEHAPYWMDDYFKTVKIDDHTMYAKDEETYLKSMAEMMANFTVHQADKAPEDAPAVVTVEDEDGSYDVHTVEQ